MTVASQKLQVKYLKNKITQQIKKQRGGEETINETTAEIHRGVVLSDNLRLAF